MRVHSDPHLHLNINAAVVAMGFHRLGDQQHRDRQQADRADGGQQWVGVSPHHFARRELLVAVVGHDICLQAPIVSLVVGVMDRL